MNPLERAPGPSRRNNGHRRPNTTQVDTPSSSRASQRRKKSRSPDARNSQLQVATQRYEPAQLDAGKKKKSANPVPFDSRPFLVPHDDANSERGRKYKSKSRQQGRQGAEHPATASALAVENRPKKDRSKSRDSAHRQIYKAPASDSEGVQALVDLHLEYQGPLAAAEFAKLKRELETWKKLAHDNKKTIKKQNKMIEDLRQKASANEKKLKETESQVSKAQTKVKKSEDAISNVETNLQCQICMELLLKPYALSPCGHVLCVSCLQEWFKKAPPSDDEMYDDDPDYLLYRKKTCPCCRGNIRNRPIPVFIVKSIASTLLKVRGLSPNTSSPTTGSPAADTDPWEGLFPPDDEIEDYGSEDDDDEDDDDEDDDWLDDDVFSYGTGSDGEPYDGDYVLPQWAPPGAAIDEEDYLFDHLSRGDLNVLRRGATLGMLHEYDMWYVHDEGLVAHDELNNRIFLGWNISLSADDEDGSRYIQWVTEDMDEHPERWRMVHLDSGKYEAHRLIPEDDVCDYSDSDSDHYMAESDGEF
ncbi:uncharacterized protein EDB91DRAFT_1137212 [Suillus paluster]|uniref:uncharacterized protein n=1 Tax=Suillus paluster TaxID=48578 RepID=UPI001B867DFC|nr:uncharacterized protein EDB91DRAFT_1137212 [Suillus paluster]KAG1738892.1 hypothetical protein EDB91DRAFT_1137212 [Suillus paluster]